MSYVKVGKIGRLTGTGERFIEREYYSQGYIFKDEEAFLDIEHPDRVCYVPELSDNEYTRNAFLKLTKGNEQLAREIFDYCDWQHPESAFDDFACNYEIGYCPKCDRYEETNYDGTALSDDYLGECPICKSNLVYVDGYREIPLRD